MDAIAILYVFWSLCDANDLEISFMRRRETLNTKYEIAAIAEKADYTIR